MGNKNTFKKPNPKRTRSIVIFAILTAIIVLMAFTPLGYLRVGVVSITFLMIPVIIGAATLGPLGGLGLGLVFAITSFVQSFGMSAFGTLIFSINPWLTALNLFFPRLLFGYVAGWLYRLFKKTIKNELVSDALTMLLSVIIHTSVFVIIFYFCFSKDPNFQKYGDTFFKLIWAMFGINAIVEWIVCTFVGAGVLKALTYFIDRYDKRHSEKQETAESQPSDDEELDDFEKDILVQEPAQDDSKDNLD